MSQLHGLFHRFGGSANQILLLLFHPEMRWIIRQIGEDGCERRFGQALAQRAIEIRNQRNNDIALAFAPELLQQPDLAAMIQTDQTVHRHGQLRSPERPALFQQCVVDILHPDSGIFPENVERIQNLLQIDQPNLPIAAVPAR